MGQASGSGSIQVPIWAIIVGVVAVLVVLGGVVGYMIGKGQPSDADLAVRAMAGDKEAAAKLDQRFATKTPEPISRKEANLTPGPYTVPNGKATDGADVVASFYLFAAQGEIDQALSLADDPSSTELAGYLDDLIQDFGLRNLLTNFGGITIQKIPKCNLYNPETDNRVHRGEPIIPNKVYLVDGVVPINGSYGRWPAIKQRKDGAWVIASSMTDY